MLSSGWLIWIIIGLIYTVFEHRTFDFDFSELDNSESVIIVLQQIIHYIRTTLLWPLYMAEDFLIFLNNLIIVSKEEDE